MKKIIKRLLALLCAVCVAIPLCSCGIKEKVDDWLSEKLDMVEVEDIEFEQKENIIF